MKKIKIYLDTNIIYGYFKTRIEESSKKEFKEPFTLFFIRNNINLLSPITSFFTMLEVSDNLKKDFSLTSTEIINCIRNFRTIYPIKILEQIEVNSESLKWLLHGIELKDTIQLNIAKNLRALFISSDKHLIKLAKKFYKNSFTFQELTRIISLFY